MDNMQLLYLFTIMNTSCRFIHLAVGDLLYFARDRVGIFGTLMVELCRGSLGCGTPCPILHVRGDNHVISSCYDVEEHVWALLSQLQETSVDLYNAASAEEVMTPQVERLKYIFGREYPVPSSWAVVHTSGHQQQPAIAATNCTIAALRRHITLMWVVNPCTYRFLANE
jgi:hypothetical protein